MEGLSFSEEKRRKGGGGRGREGKRQDLEERK
jgi:hypothetical protein